jgi:hypothetical protein
VRLLRGGDVVLRLEVADEGAHVHEVLVQDLTDGRREVARHVERNEGPPGALVVLDDGAEEALVDEDVAQGIVRVADLDGQDLGAAGWLASGLMDDEEEAAQERCVRGDVGGEPPLTPLAPPAQLVDAEDEGLRACLEPPAVRRCSQEGVARGAVADVVRELAERRESRIRPATQQLAQLLLRGADGAPDPRLEG